MKKQLLILVPVLLLIAIFTTIGVRRHLRFKRLFANTQAPGTAPLTLDENFAIGKAACTGLLGRNAEHQITCSVCPQGSDFATPAGSPLSKDEGWVADGALTGHFTVGDADEALLHASGCESHAKGWGGDFLLERKDGQWRAVRYATGGMSNNECLRLPWQDGRDALVCRNGDMHQGFASDAVSLMLFDRTAPEGEGSEGTTLLEVTDESANCGVDTTFEGRPRTMQFAKIDGVELPAPGADGIQSIVIQSTIARAESTHNASGSCPAGKPKNYRLVYRRDGDHFDAAEGYVALNALRRKDCCEILLTQKVHPAKF